MSTTDEATVDGLAEPVETDDGNGDDLEPEAHEGDETADVAQPVDAETLAQLEAKRKKLAQSATNWRNRVSELLGEEAQFLVPCELCEPDIPGFHFPAELVQPWSEQHARLLDVLRSPAALEYVAATDVRTCDTCNGHGKTTTGSRVPSHEAKVCAACNGYGYVPPPGVTRTPGADGVTPPTLAPAPEGPAVVEDADAWGSPRLLPDGRENPNYGKMPQYKDGTLP
jgi:hypothetical protein